MITDFTSALFLGLGHGEGPAFPGPLTEGKPAALQEPRGSGQVAAAFAASQGAEAGLLARTSLHALTDVLTALADPGCLLLLDRHVYPIGEWAAAIAARRGSIVSSYRHQDAAHARQQLARYGRRGAVVLTDGWCGGCLRPAPLLGLARAADEAGATLVVDDSLACGVLGHHPDANRPLGTGGGGTPSWCGLESRHRLVWVGSTAKAYGAPLAAITGSRASIDLIRRRGPSRTHASPPTPRDIAALGAALRQPDLEARRARLSALVRRTRDRACGVGLVPVGRAFPLITLRMPARQALRMREVLLRDGVSALVTTARCPGSSGLSLLLRSDHTDVAIDRLVRSLGPAARSVAA